jgi:hypothetical protein
MKGLDKPAAVLPFFMEGKTLTSTRPNPERREFAAEGPAPPSPSREPRLTVLKNSVVMRRSWIVGTDHPLSAWAQVVWLTPSFSGAGPSAANFAAFGMESREGRRNRDPMRIASQTLR